MNKNLLMSRHLLDKRLTKLSTKDQDVDWWLDRHNFKLFNFNDETYYVRYLVIDSIQYKITISCVVENNAVVFIQNCENGKNYEERIKFKTPHNCEDKHRIEILSDSFIKGFKNLGVDLKSAEDYYNNFIKSNK